LRRPDASQTYANFLAVGLAGAPVSVVLPDAAIQVVQVGTAALGGPWLSGFISKVEARLQGRRGPRVLQPFYDLAKLFRKESLAPEGASWFFLAAPFFALVSYLIVPMLIPVVANFGLPLSYIGDIFAGGFLLTLGGVVTAIAAADTGAPYAQIGSSRAVTFAEIGEPVVLFIVFTVAITTGTDLPFAESAITQSTGSQILRPGHLLAAAALFMVLLAETARIPVETHTSTTELGMIDEARTFEHSGPYLALFKWASMSKQFVFYILLVNLFLAPWGLATSHSLAAVAVGVVSSLAKFAAVGVIVVVIDNSFSKLRLFKITEFIAAAFLLAVLAVFVLFLRGD
jgi:formate hydrogenlyase subunit 4